MILLKIDAIDISVMVLIAVSLFFIIFSVIRKLKKRKEEDFTIIPSESGEMWLLGRRMNYYVPHPDHPDSKSFLENLGFKILGNYDEMHYGVEPPKGWKILHYDPRGLHLFVIDEKGVPQFWIFEKLEFHDFKAFIYLSEEMNKKVE